MPNKVYVYNANTYPHRATFKGEEITLGAKDYWKDKDGSKKVFDIYEANDFKGQYSAVPCDGSGKMVPDPKYFKIIELHPVPNTESDSVLKIDEATGFKCMALNCKHVSPSAEELEAHTNVRHPGMDKLILPEEDARLKAKKATTKAA